MKLGIFGLCRGLNFVNSAKLNNVDVVAICDWDPKRIETAMEKCPKTTVAYSDFDQFIEHDMDAVVIANYFLSKIFVFRSAVTTEEVEKVEKTENTAEE